MRRPGAGATPAAQEPQRSPEADAAFKARFGQAAPTGLTVQMKLHSRPEAIDPGEGDELTLFPVEQDDRGTPTAADGERTSSTMPRGNDTLLGAADTFATPTARDSKGRPGAGATHQNLTVDAHSWPTPTAHDSKGAQMSERRSEMLPKSARNWPTPTASDGPRGSSPDRVSGGGSETLKGAMQRDARDSTGSSPSGPPPGTTPTDGLRGSLEVDLNPRFVEALMGVPSGWLTPSISAGTGSFHRWLRARSWRSPSGHERT